MRGIREGEEEEGSTMFFPLISGLLLSICLLMSSSDIGLLASFIIPLSRRAPNSKHPAGVA